MQGAHDWAENLDKYYNSCTNSQIYSEVIDEELMLISTWIDNILEASVIIASKETAKTQLSSSYEIKDLRKTTLILEMQITQNNNSNITLS